jgi:hypothetical protein
VLVAGREIASDGWDVVKRAEGDVSTRAPSSTAASKIMYWNKRILFLLNEEQVRPL